MAGPWEDYQAAPGLTSAPWEDYQPVKEEGTLTKLARMPKEAVSQIPYVGKAASFLVPETPGQWGALAGLAATSAIPGLGQLGLAGRVGASALGAMGGSVAGGQTEPTEIAKEGATAAAGQALGEGAGKALGAGAGYVGRQLKGGTQKLLDEYGSKLAALIPNIGGQKFTPTRFFDVVMGGKGDKALSDAYQAGVSDIQKQVGPNAFLQNPTITGIIKKYLPNAEYSSNLSVITEPLRNRGATAPAHLVLDAGTNASGGFSQSQPITVENAMKAAQEIAARARLAAAKPEGAILGREMRQANIELRNAIADELNNTAPGTGDTYKAINDAFRRGITTLDVLKDNADKIFQQSATKPVINTGALARAHNMAAAELERAGAGELGAAARRGADIGAGDVSMKIPGTGIFFGGSGVRGRLSEGGLSIPSYAGQPAGSPVSPYVSGTIGQMTINRLIDELEKLKNRNP